MLIGCLADVSQCDLRPGGCEKCEKSGWKCEGYRDVGAMMFHDESENVKTKVRASQQKKKAERSPPSKAATKTTAPRAVVQKTECQVSLSSDSPDSDSTTSASPRSISSISPSLDDLAIGWFFDKYVFKAKDRQEIWDIDDGNGCLHSSILALGLAGATKQTGRGDAITHPAARKHYLAAIKQTNQALRNPEDVKRDSTLQAINILAIFEIISGLERSLNAWRDHINGAASLLQLRGTEQFKTHTGCRLFMQTTSNLVIACLARRLPVPPHVTAMQEVAQKHIPDPNDTVWRFHCNGMKLANLNARLLPGHNLRHPSEAQEIITEALEIFEEFNDTVASASEEWKPRLVNDTGPVIYADYYYVFKTSIVTQMFCAMCSYRILLIQIMHKALTTASTDPTFLLEPHQIVQLQEALGSIKDLQLAILASIPQYFGPRFLVAQTVHEDSAAEKDTLWENFDRRDFLPFRSAEKKTRDLPFVRMAGGYLIQFPLFTAGAADPPGGPIRNWVIGMMKLMGQTMGIQHAFVMADWLGNVDGKGLVPLMDDPLRDVRDF